MSFFSRLFGQRSTLPDPQQLSQIVIAFIKTDEYAKLKSMIEQHTELLSNEADTLILRLTAGQKDAQVVRNLNEHRELLRRCRAEGVAATFDKLMQPITCEELQSTLLAFVRAGSGNQAKRIVERHPELLSDEADHLMGKLIELQRSDQSVRTLTHCRDLLRRCRAEGSKAVLDYSPPSPPLYGTMMLSLTLQEFFGARNLNELRKSVEQHPELLTEEADQVLGQLIGLQTDHRAANVLTEQRELLRRCRLDGMVGAFARTTQPPLFKGVMPTFPPEFFLQTSRSMGRKAMLDLMRVDPDTANEFMRQFLEVLPSQDKAFQEFVSTESWVTQRELVGQHPELLSDWADHTLARHIASLHEAGNVNVNEERQLIECRNTLRRCREVGVTQAFSEKEQSAHEEPEVAQMRGWLLQLPGPLRNVMRELFPASETEIDELAIDSHEKMASFVADRLTRRPDLYQKLEEAFLSSQPPYLISKEIKPLLFVLFTPFMEKLSRQSSRSEAVDRVKLYTWGLALVGRRQYPEFWAILQDRLGNCLVACPAGALGGNIERAIQAFNQALQVHTREAMPTEWAESTIGLAMAYSERTEGNRAENREHALSLCREALQVLTREDSPDAWARAMCELSSIYSSRVRGDRAENWERAIEASHQALHVFTREAWPDDWAITMMNLATAYQQRIRGDKAENIEHAIEIYEQALGVYTREAMPIEWARTLLELAHAFLARIEGERVENIERAIEIYQQALQVRTYEAMPVEWARTMSGLADAYMSRERGDPMENSERAITIYRQVLDVWTSKYMLIERARTMAILATFYLTRAQGNRVENVQRAVEIYQDALDSMSPDEQPVFCRITAYMLGNLYMDEGLWAEAHAAYAKAIAANESLYQATATEVARQTELSKAVNLFANDAYCLARLGSLPEAVERLEAGKTRALTEALARDQVALEQASSEDRHAFEVIRDRIKALEIKSRALNETGSNISPELSFMEVSAELTRARHELAELVTRIRAYVPDFMPSGLDFKSIASSVAPACPLVYLTTTSQGSLALIVTSKAESLNKEHLVWLDTITLKDLNNWLLQRDVNGNVTGGYLMGQVGGDKRLLQAALDQTLATIGERLMEPLANRLTALGFRQFALILGGCLALLPLHAVCYSSAGNSCILLDEFEVSYVPSARTLAASHHTIEMTRAYSPSLFAVCDPPHTDAPRLTFAHTEVEGIIPLFPAHAVLSLREAQATKANTIQSAPGYRYLHFSCHGYFDPMEPLQSALLLAGNDSLTLRDILDQANFANTRLAVLSACQTAISDFQNVPDEAVGLPAGFIQVGVPGVVGSLWPVNDLSTALLMIRFYEYHLKEGLHPAAALRKAQLWLRDVTNAELAEMFQKFKATAPDIPELMTSLARERFTKHALADPNERPFAHPYYWAAFAFYGV